MCACARHCCVHVYLVYSTSLRSVHDGSVKEFKIFNTVSTSKSPVIPRRGKEVLQCYAYQNMTCFLLAMYVAIMAATE